jgi:DNA-binding protein HU-beta
LESGAGSTTFTKGKPVNKSQFIDKLAAQFDHNKKGASTALDAVLGTIMRELVRGEKVALTGFGAFESVARPRRQVRNPRTGQRVWVKKTAVPKFRAGAELKAVVAGEKKLPKAAPAAVASARKTTSSTTTSATKKSSPAKRTTAKKSTAKKTTGTGTAKKSTARKSTAKTSTAKKATGTARKTTAKKTSGTGTAKKTTAKRATPAKKTTAKKTTAKKASPARKTTAKKTTARKTTAKKS